MAENANGSHPGHAAPAPGAGRTSLLLVVLLSASSAGPASAQVTLVHAAGYHAGGGPLGGGHPTAGAYSFTVPEGKDRLLLVLGPPKYDPSIPRKVSSQRECLTSLTYARRPLEPLAEKEPRRSAYGGPVFWYLVDPPAGTHDLNMRQFRVDNGGENRMAALALTGVDPKEPFGQRLATLFDGKTRTVRYRMTSRRGGTVVDSIFYGGRRHKYFRIMPGPGQKLLWENCHDYRYEWMGSARPGADVVEMRWDLAGNARCFLRAVALNPSQPAAAPKAGEPLESPPADPLGAEAPGLVARLYDLSAHPPRPGTARLNYMRPARGSRIPRFDRKTLHTTKVVDRIDFHPNDYKTNPHRLPDEKGVLASGIRSNFVLEFTGRIHIPESGQVMFKLLSVDQAKLLIDGRLVVDNHGHNYNTLKTGVIGLKAGKHEFRLINVEDTGTFGVSLGWRLPGGHPHGIPRGRQGPIRIIPASAFTHTDEHLK